MTRDDWQQYERIRYKPDVVLAMEARCEEGGTSGRTASQARSSFAKFASGADGIAEPTTKGPP